MRFHHKLLAGALALAILLSVNFNTKAQDFRIGVSAAPDPVLVGNELTYTIFVTNTAGPGGLGNVFVTNTFSAGVIFSLQSNPSGIGEGTTNDHEIIFPLGISQDLEIHQISFILLPLTAGSLTNQITAVSVGRLGVTTDVYSQVDSPTADLGISMTNVATGVFAGDTTTIGLTITNRGPNTASNIMLTNTLPLSFDLLSVTPTNSSLGFTNGILTMNLGSLTSGSSTQLQVLIRPTSGGTSNLTASVFAPGVIDTNTANNAVTNSMSVVSFLTNPGDLTTTVVTQRFNFLTGLLEVSVILSNTTTNAVPAALVLASNLPAGARLYNGAGVYNGNGYALYNAELAAGANVDLLLEFYVLKVAAFTNYTLVAFGVPVLDLNAPTNSGAPVTAISYGSGGFLIKFAATIGKTYTVLYSDDASFTNALTSQPSIVAPATQVQWIDNGPPKTASNPGAQRFYRVIQNN